MKNLAVTLAWVFAVVFLAATVLGFAPNPLVGKNAFFVTNVAHNLVHLATAVGFVVVAWLGERASIRFMQAFGVVYLLTSLIGFVVLGSRMQGYLLGIIHINQLDNVLHLGLGITIAAAGWIAQSHTNRPALASHA